jgi:iron complex outermembrane receptor protein
VFGTATPAVAQLQSSEELGTLEDLLNVDITTASLVPQAARHAPATTFVITEATIRQRGYTTLLDLLADVPEVQIQHRAQVDVNNYVTFRGIGGGIGNEKFIILIDGVRLSPASGDWYPVGKQFSLANAKQVEIIMGPASALYGADAFAGVINVVTRTGTEVDGGSATAGYGMYGTFDGSVAVGSNLGKLPGAGGILDDVSLAFTGHIYRSDNPFMPKYYPEEYAWYNDQYSQNGNVRASVFAPPEVTRQLEIKPYTEGEDALYLHPRLNLKALEVGFVRATSAHSSSTGVRPEFSPYWDEAKLKVHLQSFYATHYFQTPDERFLARTSVQHQVHTMDPESAFINSFSGYSPGYKYGTTRTLSVSEQVTAKLAEGLPLVAGFSFSDYAALPRTDNLPSPYDTDFSADEQRFNYQGTEFVDGNGNSLAVAQDIHFLQYQNAGGFAQLQFARFDALEVTGGARIDHNTRYGTTFNPRAAVVVKPSDLWNVKLMYGEAYLAPSPYKSYLSFGSFFPSRDMSGEITGLQSAFLFRPNAELEPEKLRSVETSVTVTPMTGLQLQVDGYFVGISNLIQPLPPVMGEAFKGVPVTALQINGNTGEVKTWGGTARVDTLLQLGAFRFTPNMAYTFSDGEQGDGGTLMHNSRHTLRLGLDLSYQLGPGELSFSPRLFYRSRAFTPLKDADGNFESSDPYALVNLFARYSQRLGTQYLVSGFVRVDNATDTRYYNVH